MFRETLALAICLIGILAGCSRCPEAELVERLSTRDVEDLSKWIDSEGNYVRDCDEICASNERDCSVYRIDEGPPEPMSEGGRGGAGGEASDNVAVPGTLYLRCSYWDRSGACE